MSPLKKAGSPIWCEVYSRRPRASLKLDHYPRGRRVLPAARSSIPPPVAPYGGLVITVGSLVMLGADPPPVTCAWFTCGDVAAGRTFTVTVIGGKDAPGARVVVRVQWVGLHVQPVPAIETGVKPEGGSSFTLTVPAVVPAPTLFDTVKVYVAVV